MSAPGRQEPKASWISTDTGWKQPARDAGSRATFVGDRDEAFAVIAHDAALDEDDRQLEAAAAAAGMALLRERLRAELRGHLQLLSDSRERLIDAVDNQRLAGVGA